MSFLSKLFNIGGGFFRKGSNNNRKMTKGRIATGKSTYKGTEAEHRDVKLEKEIREKARMLFAVDLKLKYSVEGQETNHLRRERNKISGKLDSLIKKAEKQLSNDRFMSLMEDLDQKDTRQREKYGLKVA